MDLNKFNLEFQERADPRVLEVLGKIGSALALLYKRPLVLPKIFQIKGSVEVVKSPDVKITNFQELAKYFASLEQKLTIWAQAASTAPAPRIELPKFDFPKNETIIDFTQVIDAIKELDKSLQQKPIEKSPDTTILRKIQDAVENLANRPTMTPQPVTNVWLNPSDGFIKTTATTVGTTRTTLPAYGQLLNRRALQIYNNSANTIYYGGTDVLTTNGIPVAAGDFSNVFDAGYNCIVYGIAATSGNDIRVIEISKDQSGTVQE